MDVANHPRLRVNGVYMEKVEISSLGLGVQYGILAHNMDRDICTLYIPDKSTIIVLDDVDPELKGEHLHGSKYGRCPCTFKRVLQQIVKFDPNLAMAELTVLHNDCSSKSNYKNGIYEVDIEYTLYLPGDCHPEIIKVQKTTIKGEEKIYINTND